MFYVVIKLFREKYKQERGLLALAHLIDSLPYMHKDLSSIPGINGLFSCLGIVTNYLEKRATSEEEGGVWLPVIRCHDREGTVAGA